MKNLILIVSLLFSGLSNKAFAQVGLETQPLLETPFAVPAGETWTFPLEDWARVEYLKVVAVSIENQDATFNVVVNGIVKGTIRVPGLVPFYIVNVEEVTSSIQLQSLDSGDGEGFQILQIFAFLNYEIPMDIDHHL